MESNLDNYSFLNAIILLKTMNIRKAQLSDLYQLAVLKQQVWISTYATEGICEDFSRYVLSEFALNNVEKSICDTKQELSVATIDDNIVGCAELSLLPDQPIPEAEPCPELKVLYILEKFQRSGIGKKLLTNSIHTAKQMGFKNIWLSAYYKNTKAIEFYTKNNFRHIGDTNFILGKQKYKNLILLKKIS
jgi:diamine N-acetyltransferase